MIKIAPSVLSADFVNMEKSIRLIESAGCEFIHLDLMDGRFVPPITFGHHMVKAIRGITDLILDAHLMIEEPQNQINFLAEAGADYITVHWENTVHTHRIIQQIQNKGLKAGISIIPSTPVSAIVEILNFVDLVLVMTVNPGFGGQKLIPECIDKIRLLDKIRQDKGYRYLISADGGINQQTVKLFRETGLDIAVAGSAFFGSEDPVNEVLLLSGRI